MVMRVLWVSASIFDDKEERQSGAWQKAMAEKLVEQNDIVLGNISYQPQTKAITRSVYKKIIQWGIPCLGRAIKGMPPQKVCALFEHAVSEFNPDIIHVWGSENPFKLLPFQHNIPGIKVLAIQGVLNSMGPNCLRGMSAREMISTIGIRELIKGNSIFSVTRAFFNEGKIENSMILKSDHIITQSDWTDSQIHPVNPRARLYRTRRVLRDVFTNCKKWTDFSHDNPILFSSAIGYSWKGLHVLIKALPLVKMQYPDIQVRLAGKIGRTDIFGDGYLRMMLKMIKNNGLEDNVVWLNDITATEIVMHLQQASVYINPSFVESYSNTVAEAMSVGTPSVVTFAGAMPELAENNKEVLYFTPGDYMRCAHLICKLLADSQLSKEISINTAKRSEERNARFDTVKAQIKIYEDILLHSGKHSSHM